jgi:hypothetical protein
MIPFYFAVLPGEHIYSWFARCFWLSGKLRREEYLRQKKVSYTDLRPNEPLSQAMALVCKTAVQFNPKLDLPMCATPMPIWALSMEPTTFLSFLKRYRGNIVSDDLHMREFDMLAGTQEWKACKTCIAEDIEKFGCSMWHTKHQLSGCLNCYKHAARLVTPEKRMSSMGALQLPHQINRWQYASGADSKLSQEFSEFYSRIFDMSIEDAACLSDLKYKFWKLLGIESRSVSQKQLACVDLETQLADTLGIPFLANMFTYYSEGKNSHNCGVLAGLTKIEAKGYRVRNPIFWVTALFWKRRELHLVKSEPAHACAAGIHSI